MAKVKISFQTDLFLHPPEADDPDDDNVTIEESSRAPGWAVGDTYAVGDRVDYEGVIYVCIQAHTVYAPNWTPPNTPALWELE